MTMDHRIHVSLSHLRGLERAAAGLSFLPRQPSGSVINGRHQSRLRGRGLNFEEMRDYQFGDDVRAIDWRATARTGRPHVRVFTEERDRPALLVVDQRMSMFFGSRHNMKSVTAAEAAAIAAFRILKAGDRVGGIVFNETDTVEIAPRRRRRSVHSLLEAIALQNQVLAPDRVVEQQPGGLNVILKSCARLATHDHLVIVFSDFDGIDESTRRYLDIIARHNDLILVHVHDPLARRRDSRGRTVIGDGRRQTEIDLDDPRILESYNRFHAARLGQIEDWQRQINLSLLPLSAAEETLGQIRRLMAGAAPRRRFT